MDESPSKESLSEKLFQLGHEHVIDGDIFNMELTPNRGDCLSLNGLARDLNIFFSKKKSLDIYDKHIEDLDIKFENLSPLDCPKISFLEIEIEGEVSEYEPYLENYFSYLGNNKTNFFTDISNYISYELGQPTHCFDSKKVDGELTFEKKELNTSFKTLLGSEIKLSGKNCIFLKDDKVISLAGVMGGISSACSAKTKKALIECAFFNTESIIGKTVKYNLVSDAAHKFERGVDISSQETVLRRFIKVVQDHASIKDIKLKSFGKDESKKNILDIDVARINKILGTEIQETDYLTYLTKLGFYVDKKITVPSYRHDVSSQNDLAEEIARLIGYDKIEKKSFKIKHRSDPDQKSINKIRHFLTKNGFFEVINFPFTSSSSEYSIKIDNPLDSNKKMLRTSLKDSLLENLLYNERRQKDSIKIFEISDVYLKENQIDQQKRIGVIISGRKAENYNDFTKRLDANFLEDILNKGFKIKNLRIEEISRDGLKTKKKDKIFFTEILVDEIECHTNDDVSLNKINFIKYNPVSEFPQSARDFSFSIKNSDIYNEVIDSILNLEDENLKHSFIFDFYENKEFGEVKVGLRLIFQSNIKTLSDEDIQKSIKKILSPIIKLKGVSVPGL